MIRRPRLGQITQGTVFCGAVAENYDGIPVWGVVITARCDTAHDKTPVVNYLPVVRIEDWLGRQGGLLIVDRALKNAMGGFKTLLIQRQLSASLLDVYAPADLTGIHFTPLPGGSKNSTKDAKECAQANSLAAEISQLQRIQAAQQIEPDTIRLEVLKRSSLMHGILKDLFTHQLPGYYYIPSLGDLTENPSGHGYVTILREAPAAGQTPPLVCT